MTGDELWAVMFPLDELPECDEIWVEGAEWTSEVSEDGNYGHECRYGSGDGKRYEAEVHYCYADGKPEGLLVVGPDDLYIWLGDAAGGSDYIVEDGSGSGVTGERVVDIARRNCDE